MSTQRLPSNWLNEPTDEQFIEKSVGRGLGTITAGAPLAQRLAKLAETEVVCKSGHASTLGKIESVTKCKCGAAWATAKGEKLEEDESTPVYVGTTKSADEMPTGGSIDGQPIMTSKSRVRRPFTGSR
jgi:hypothetical protein